MDLKELRKKCEAATPGPWISRYDDRVTVPDDIDGTKSLLHSYYGQPNQQFVAAANPQVVLSLLDRVESLESQLAEALNRNAVLTEALEWYAEDSQFSSGEIMTPQQKRDMDDYGSTAREALSGEPTKAK